MNRLISKVNLLILTIMLVFSYAVFAGTATFGGSSGSGTADDPTDTTNVPQIVGSLEQVVTVVKNETQEVTGNLFCSLPFGQICPDSDPLSIELQSSPAGNYGFLEIFGNEKFRYVIKNDLPQVQALGFQDVATDVFHYEIKEGGNAKTRGTLTVYILGNPSVSFDNVEIEPNNNLASCGTLHVGSPTQVSQHMRGQLSFTGDSDCFLFNSLGNEIINLELCPEGSHCRDENAWAMYVFDADKFAQQNIESQTYPIRRYIKETNEVLDVAQADHMYLLLHKGILQDSLVGVIDPCFGDRRTLDIGVGPGPKNYMVAITTPLLREVDADEDNHCGSGDVIREEEIQASDDDDQAITIIQEFLEAIFSDDQYTLKVTRTGADPFAVIQPDSVLFDVVGRKLDVPRLRVNDSLFGAELQAINAENPDAPLAFAVQSFELLNEPLTANPYLPTYNPANQIVKIPQVVIPESGAIYSVELLVQPEEGQLLLLRADPVNLPADSNN